MIKSTFSYTIIDTLQNGKQYMISKPCKHDDRRINKVFSKHFPIETMECPCCGKYEINPIMIYGLEELGFQCGYDDILILQGYICNNALNIFKTPYHESLNNSIALFLAHDLLKPNIFGNWISSMKIFGLGHVETWKDCCFISMSTNYNVKHNIGYSPINQKGNPGDQVRTG